MPWFHSSALFSSIKLFFPTTLCRFKFLCTSISWAGLQLTRGLSREPTASDNASNMFDILFPASRGEILAKIKCARPSDERPASSASWGRWLSVYLTCAAGLKQERKSDLLLALYGFQCCWLIAEGRRQVKSCGKLMYKKFKHVVKKWFSLWSNLKPFYLNCESFVSSNASRYYYYSYHKYFFCCE